ncbi:MAG TPA: sulfurtransferase TusA family protein [Nitrospiria bacterium]|nr:sulfurtransferase TusA family protein [Nitrospiria bacterium]
MSDKNNGSGDFLDLRGVLCPYNYVKTKIKLETMEIGELLSVIVDDGEPIRNVPRSVSQDGHSIIKQEPFEGGFHVLIKKQV